MKKSYKRPVRLVACAATACVLAVSLAGCGSSASNTTTNTASNTTTVTTTNTASNTTSQASSTSSTGSTYSTVIADYDIEYTDRDQDASYSASASTTITLSGNTATIQGDGATFENSTLTISAKGTYVISGTLDDGEIVVDLGDADDKVQLVLNGVTISNADGPAIDIESADKVFITLASGSVNTLTDGSTYTLEDGSDEPYATIYSKDDLTINGTGTLNVTGNYAHAIASKDDLVITGGTFNITAKEDALRGRDCVKILDGTFNITAGEDAVKSNNDEDEGRGYVIIDGGTFTISAGDDAFHAERVFAINGGTVNVTTCYEGYEAQNVFVNGGTTHIVASDDALNASAVGSGSDSFGMGMGGAARQGATDGTTSGASACLIEINGGYTVLDATGDGVDSNGSFAMYDGVLLVSGPTNSGNGAFDYDISAQVYGGTAILLGSTGMAQSFTGGSQAFGFVTASGNAGSNVAITDGSGNVLVSFTATKQFQCAVVTAPGMSEGSTYNLVVGGTVSGANSDGYATSGTVSGGTSTSFTASTTATQGYGGLGSDGQMMGAGQHGSDNGRGGMAMGGSGQQGGAAPGGAGGR